MGELSVLAVAEKPVDTATAFANGLTKTRMRKWCKRGFRVSKRKIKNWPSSAPRKTLSSRWKDKRSFCSSNEKKMLAKGLKNKKKKLESKKKKLKKKLRERVWFFKLSRVGF